MKAFRLIEAGMQSHSDLSKRLPSAEASAASRELRKRYGAGFSMIELMIVVAIIAILTAIAYPSYITYITKSHRVAAEGCLSTYANYMERFYTTNLSYNTDKTTNPPNETPANSSPPPGYDCATTAQTGNFYRYDIPSSSLSSSAYVITATPINSQLTRDTKCGVLSVDQAGHRLPSTQGCW